MINFNSFEINSDHSSLLCNKNQFQFKNCIIFFPREIPSKKFLTKLKMSNNILIHDMLEFITGESIKYSSEHFKTCISDTYLKQKNGNLFDIIISNSEYMKKMLKKNTKNTIEVIYHHHDPRISLTQIKNDNVFYIGSKYKLDTDIPGIQIIDWLKIKNYLLNSYPCIHIDFVQSNNLYYIFHTSTKLATALSTNSIFICNKIPVYEELLGPDYPFYVEDENDIPHKIKKAQDLINDYEKYTAFLLKYEQLKKKLSISSISNYYSQLISSIFSNNYRINIFDEQYLKRYPDISHSNKWKKNPFKHYVTYGKKEGRIYGIF
tara:strand:- start:1419 stop:2378 length:960 start_codon:yes stop_codon:yes gene_type:complete